MPELRAQLEAKADELAALPEDWDSYGALPPRREVLQQAVEVALLLSPMLGNPWLVPGHDGVQVEWHEKGFDVECFIDLFQEVENAS